MRNPTVITSAHQEASPTHRMLRTVQTHPLVSFFVLAYGLAWLIEIPVLLLLGGRGHLPLQLAALLGPLAGPALSAFLVTSALEGKAGIRRLLRGYAIWRVGLRWYAFALLGIPALIVAGALVLPGVAQSAQAHAPLGTTVRGYLIALALGGLIGGPFLEEFGWRGFALPRLQRLHGPLGASLLLGVLWGFWHSPFFLPGGFVPQGMSALMVDGYVLTAIGVTLLMTWVYNHTRGSLLLAFMVHASVDAAGDWLLISLFPSSLATTTALPLLIGLGVAALVVIILTRGRLGYARAGSEHPVRKLTHQQNEQHMATPERVAR